MDKEQLKEIRNSIIWALDETLNVSERDIAKIFNRANSTINRVIQEKPENRTDQPKE